MIPNQTMTVLLHLNLRPLIVHSPADFLAFKTEVQIDGASIKFNKHFTIQMIKFMKEVPTDGGSIQRWSHRWRHCFTYLSPSFPHVCFQDRSANRWRCMVTTCVTTQSGRLSLRHLRPNYPHDRRGWLNITNSSDTWSYMMLLRSRPWVHGPPSMPHTFARSPWLPPPPIFLPLQDPGSTTCMCMCMLTHAGKIGEQFKTEVHAAPPSEVLVEGKAALYYHCR